MNTQIYPQSSVMLFWQIPLAKVTMREARRMGQSGGQAAWVLQTIEMVQAATGEPHGPSSSANGECGGNW